MTIEQQYKYVQEASRTVSRIYGKVGLTFGEQLDLLNITAAMAAAAATRPHLTHCGGMLEGF